ncbi:MAG: UDP-N-acetylenolpyruvoylglucosamine reductase [Alistipes sp. 58_9_plus]|nr:MAG: UDP-N-acetylenolpyruvoylglucosamine reductase [Alistipes sp. 58_9_plus]
MIRETADAPLRQRNSFHVEEQAERLIEFDREEDLDLIFGKGRPERWYVLGGGNNILFTRRFEGTLIKPAATGITVIGEDADTVTLRAEAATDWDRMVAWCVERGLWGAENLSLIPGTVGASPVQNIGAYGAEAAGIIYRVHLYDTLRREHVTLEKADCHFAYRDSIFKHEMRGRTVITAVELRLGKHPSPNLAYGDLKAQVEARGGASIANIRNAVCAIRRSKLPDPDTLGNAGSFFKNPVVDNATAERLREEDPACPVYPVSAHGMCKLAAGWLIDRAGLKGFRMGRVGVHERQALVLVNFGGATGNDVMALARYVQQRVFDSFGVRIEPEVNIL